LAQLVAAVGGRIVGEAGEIPGQGRLDEFGRRVLRFADRQPDFGEIGGRGDAGEELTQFLERIGLKLGQVGIHGSETMTQSNDYRAGKPLAIASLVAGATVWGLIWYPYRKLEAAGLPGVTATVLTYAVALVLALPIFRRQLRGARIDGWLVAIALSAAGCNLGYVVAMLHGEVMRVLLLFYLAPLWTVLLARLLLDERLTATGAAVVALSVAGAAVMLWRPELGAPWPQASGEWIGLLAGFLFALSNVLIRRASHYSIGLKSTAVFVGVVGLGLVLSPWQSGMPGTAAGIGSWLLVVLVGLVLFAINPIVQYGLMRIAASRAIVILLAELVIAAVASWALAGEVMGLREWLGGGLIVAASLYSAHGDAG
jgi:drug/metabolite transporter (DMT)-like permease